ncbi:hypothetical protein TSAR_005091 [Trichomalopsis sarcophagae]|uniref:Uncharacterized protein n=1 Tax=Trichomalopsis sarcophagae TaxID=543379 RepID=A0A232FM29_9HYME|nr:hypothetical protein TSAR_005091 [Trichomalopsis sarcophagae]
MDCEALPYNAVAMIPPAHNVATQGLCWRAHARAALVQQTAGLRPRSSPLTIIKIFWIGVRNF